MSEHLKITRAGGVLEILFARPEKKNALSNPMYTAVCEAMEAAETDDAIRVIVFGSTSEAFSTGNDLADFTGVAAGTMAPSDLRAGRFLAALANAQKPLVAACPGLAVGVGATMLLHCDLVYVAETAKLTVPFVNLALVPEAASSLLMPQRIGHARAFAMFALGEAMSGIEAAQCGLANKALPVEEVLPAAREAAAELAKKPIGALKITKRLMRDPGPIVARMQEEGALFAQRLQTGEAREAFMAFAQRRAPDFSNVA